MRLSVPLLALGVCALSLAPAASALHLYFTNRCSQPVQLVHGEGSSAARMVAQINPGSTFTDYVAGGTHLYRHGMGDQATHAEFAESNGVWYDISIIPPGPGTCNSYDDCRRRTGRAGFNVPLAIAPTQNDNGRNCRKLTCLSYDPAACSDAYQFPADIKTHDCPNGTNFNVVFCP